MKLKHQKLLKRVIPLIIAVIVVAGTVFGYLGTIFAYAATLDDTPPGCAKLISADLYDDTDLTSILPHIIRFESYTARITIEIDPDEHAIKYEELKNVRALFKTNDVTWKEKLNEILIVSLKGDTNQFKSAKLKADRTFKPTEIVSDDNDTNRIFEITFDLDSVELIAPPAIMGVTIKYRKTEIEDYDDKKLDFIQKGSGFPVGTIDSNSSSDDSSSSTTYYDDDDDDDRKSSSSEDERAIPTPKIIITSFDIPRIVEYDEEFEATVEFLNNSQYKDLVNVTMTVTPSEGAVIRNGVNQRHYVKIPRRQSTSETFRFKAVEKLAAEAITLTVKFDYEYKFNKEYKQGSSEEVLSLTAIPKPEESSSSEDESSGTEGSISAFEVLSIVPPDKIYPGDEAYFTIKVINKDHQFDASNVQVSVTGEGLVNNGNTIYHGALEHSTQAEIEVPLQFDKAGSFPLEFTVVYEDSVGKDEDKKPIVRINDIKKEYTATVLESPNAGMDMGMGFEGMMDPTLGMSGEFEDMPAQGGVAGIIAWARAHIWWVAGGGVALLVVIVLVVRFIRKKKAEDDEDL